MLRRCRLRQPALRPAFAGTAVITAALAVLVSLLAAQPAVAQRRIALVIGNSAYTHAAALPNPANDASDMANALRSVGIEVILGLDLDKRAFDAKVRELSRAIAGADVAILFYAGHGLQVGQRNYLIPIDAELASERDLEFETVPLDFVMRQMEIEREGKTNIVFLDACRDNPLARSLARSMGTRSVGVGRGLAEVQAGVGTFVAYATKPGDVALDGQGRNSPFTGALTRAIKEGQGKSLTALMLDVRRDVLVETGSRQQPWDLSSLTGDFYFHLAAAPGVMTSVPQAAAAPAGTEAMQERIKQLEDELKRKPDPQLTVKLVELSQLKERVRQLDESNKQDQQAIFAVYRRAGPANDPDARRNQSLEIGAIQRRMAERGQQQKRLREEIAKLEAEVGTAKAP